MGFNTDINPESYADGSGVSIFGRVLETLPGSDRLKFSHYTDAHVEKCTIHGGTEDCIDVNRMCNNITIKDCELHIAGAQAMTIKGDSSNVRLDGVVIYGRGRSCEIDLGNFTEVSDLPTTGVTLTRVTSEDSRSVRVRVLNAEMPTVIGGNVYAYKPWYVKVGLFKVWWWLRKHGVLRS